jgi:8-oxo-dGTP diphosphatase
MPSTGPESGTRPLIPVAAGCLVNARGEVLIAQRPEGKIAAGQWEFPGGKIEPGETPRKALARELYEELGIAVTQARPLVRITHDYSDRTVVLDTWRVAAWDGELVGREDQAFAWVAPSQLTDFPLLAADRPIVSALRLPTHYAFTPPDATQAQILGSLGSLPRRALLRLRLPSLSNGAYQTLAARVIGAGSACGVRVVLDREPEMAQVLGAAGWHASAAVLAGLRERPLPGLPCLGSCHDASELQRARTLGFDGAVLGPVLPTPSHEGAKTLGWDGFTALVADASLPVFAIGGVGPRDQERAFASYAQGTAGISAYFRR